MKPNDFQEAKRRISIEYFFENWLGTTPGKSAGRYSVCPECGPSNDNNKVSVRNGYFTCFKCGAKGDVIEAAALHFKTSAKGAVNLLLGQNDAPASRTEAPKSAPKPNSPPSPNKALLGCIAYIFSHGRVPHASHIEYLHNRGIGDKAIEFAINRGFMRFLPHDNSRENYIWLKESLGLDRLRSAGLVKPDKDFASIAYRPLVFISDDQCAAEFRLIKPAREGESKTICYGLGAHYYFLDQKRDYALVCEGPIDMLSAFELGLKGNIIGIPGVQKSKVEWFQKYSQVILALDHDEAGLKQTAILQEQLAASNIKCYLFDFNGKDLNEHLLATRSAK